MSSRSSAARNLISRQSSLWYLVMPGTTLTMIDEVSPLPAALADAATTCCSLRSCSPRLPLVWLGLGGLVLAGSVLAGCGGLCRRRGVPLALVTVGPWRTAGLVNFGPVLAGPNSRRPTNSAGTPGTAPRATGLRPELSVPRAGLLGWSLNCGRCPSAGRRGWPHLVGPLTGSRWFGGRFALASIRSRGLDPSRLSLSRVRSRRSQSGGLRPGRVGPRGLRSAATARSWHGSERDGSGRRTSGFDSSVRLDDWDHLRSALKASGREVLDCVGPRGL